MQVGIFKNKSAEVRKRGVLTPYVIIDYGLAVTVTESATLFSLPSLTVNSIV
jgi:hypothetical protein